MNKSATHPNRPDPKRRPIKKSIDYSQPSVLNFIYMCFMFIFKRFVFAPTHIKIGIYMAALIVFSIIKDFQFIQYTTYFSFKHNIFNQYFVKLGWAWTLTATIPFVLMTSIVYTSYNGRHIKKHMSRILISTVGWFIFTYLFDLIDTKTGNCSNKTFHSKHLCKTNKHEWINGHDISGHTFILMHALFLMLEEVRIFDNWDAFHKKLIEKLNSQELDPKETASIRSSNQYQRAEYLFKLLTPYIKINFIFMALLTLLWEVMLLATFLYFHTIMHKLVAAFAAVIFWFLTYKTWYANKSMPLSPGLPGDGSV